MVLLFGTPWKHSHYVENILYFIFSTTKLPKNIEKLKNEK